MPAVFERDGIRFQYPDNWSIDSQELDDGWSVTVQSPGTAFMTLSYHPGERDCAVVTDSALEALREEYPLVEADPAVETIAGQPAVGYDVRFYSLDLTNSAFIRGFACEDGCVLILSQLNDLEDDRLGPVLRAVSASVEVED